MKKGDLVSLKMKKTHPPQVPQYALVLKMHEGYSGHIVGVTVLWDNGTSATLSTPSFFEVINED